MVIEKKNAGKFESVRNEFTKPRVWKRAKQLMYTYILLRHVCLSAHEHFIFFMMILRLFFLSTTKKK